MKLFYHLESGQTGWEHRYDPADATRPDLLWHYFPSSVGMSAGDLFWETSFTGVPVLHFGLSMVQISESLGGAGESDAQYGFTEADDALTFSRRGESVTVRASFNDIIIRCSLAELRSAVKEFARTITSDLTTRYPALADVDLMSELAGRAEVL